MRLSCAGSAWVTLSRPFVEYVIMGYENLPRLALMYFANTISSPEVRGPSLILSCAISDETFLCGPG